MDDCNLSKLTIKPGKLTPQFKQDIIDYNVTLGSDIEKINLDYLTSDTGASCCVKGGDGGRTVPLTEGQINDIKLEVSAEDGTTKTYMVHVRRLSAKDATLSDLKVDKGKLRPEFSPDTFEYSGTLASDISSILVTPCVADSKVSVKVDGAATGTATSLNVGTTEITVHVTSPDGSSTQAYRVYIYKKQIPRHIRFTNQDLAMRFQCPVSLGPLYQPITVKGSDPQHSYTGPIIDHLTKTSKIDPLTELPLDKDWRFEDMGLEKEMSEVMACIQLTNGTSTQTVKLADLGSLLKECNKSPKLEEVNTKYDTNAPLKHSLETRSWEKHLQQIFDETNPSKLCAVATESLEKYHGSLPKPGRRETYADGESPIDHLKHAAYCYATAIKGRANDADLHLKLGLVLEDKYYVEDMIGIQKEKDRLEAAGSNLQARESSKEEECAAICELRGVSAGAPLSLQLKAIDEEYHQLIDNGQSQKADHVQSLFAWKSKQATQAGAAAQKASDEESPLGQAYLKYLDALSLDESKSVYHFHVGRMLVVRGEYEAAVTRLEAALGWNSKHDMAKFYLGLALSLRKEGPGGRAKEAVMYLLQTMENLLEQHTQFALSSGEERSHPTDLHGQCLLRSSNIHLLRGFIQLGLLLQAHPDIKGVMSATDVYHSAALLASQVLPEISRGDTYQQVEWVLLDAHSQLLEHLLVTERNNVKLIGTRCQQLSALIKHATIPQNMDLLNLQNKTSQMLVEIQPCSSRALYLLGNAQLSRYDNSPQAASAPQLLEDAKRSFRGSIGLEGKAGSGSASAELTEQSWWQDKIKAEEAKKAAAASAAGPGAGGSKPAARGGAAGRGGAAAGRAGAPAARGGTTPARGGAMAGRGVPARGGGASGARGGVSARGGAAAGRGVPKAGPPKTGPAAVRGTPAAGRGATKTPAARGGGAAKPNNNSHPCETKPGSAKRPASATKRPASAAKDTKTEETKPAASTEPVFINKKSYHPRLGLARALSKTQDTHQEALKYYTQVIDMAPEVHDAYVESAEMIIKSDPMAAVDIYCRFPVSKDPTFDDAYIFGEIVRLLMKAEKFDDSRLQKNLISMGKVMGIASLEKYITTLENKFKMDTVMKVYAGVNGKEMDDPDMQAFFKFKCWV